MEEVYENVIADLKEAEICLAEDEVLMPKIRKGGEKGLRVPENCILICMQRKQC